MPYTADALGDVDATKPDGATETVSILDDARREIARAAKNTVGAEHDLGAGTNLGGRHKFGTGSTAARDAITNWVVGSIWLNTDTTPAKIQRVSALGPVTFQDVADIATFNTHKAGTATVQHTAGVGDHTHQSAGAQGGTLDHGLALVGLLDDDHTQYLHLNKVAQTLLQALSVAAGITIDGVDISAHQVGDARTQHVGGAGTHTHQSTGAEGSTLDHGLALVGLGDDDHTQYLHLNKVAQTLIQSLAVAALATIDGRDISVDGAAFDAHDAGTAAAQHNAGVGDHSHQSAGAQGGTIDHGLALVGLGDDDHTQYILVSGARAFTGVVGGVAPTAAAHLATKGYADGIIPAGTVMVFFQAAAPTGWTQVTTQNDKALRVVSGAGGGVGGATAFSAAWPAHTHPHSATHTHNVPRGGWTDTGVAETGVFLVVVTNPGAGSSHAGADRTTTVASPGATDAGGAASPQFIDVILASKD